jgi:uncharacterized protein (DUF4415 family)
MPKRIRKPPAPEAVIQRHVAEDGEGEFNFDRATSWAEYRRTAGRPPLDPLQVKERITIRLDKDVLSKLRATGPGWQTRINEILRKAVA